MEEADKGWLMIRGGVSGWLFLLVPAQPGCPSQRTVKRLLLQWVSSSSNYLLRLHIIHPLIRQKHVLLGVAKRPTVKKPPVFYWQHLATHVSVLSLDGE